MSERLLLTGVAGFIGSQLAEAALGAGYEVYGVDCFTTAYSTDLKRSNVAGLLDRSGFSFLEQDLATSDLQSLLSKTDAVVHLAALPGVRASWSNFDDYLNRNVWVTQRLLEAARVTGQRRFIYASSSSVYGNAPVFPTRESDVKRPQSPYGVTKLGAEHLLETYADTFGVHGVSLRYFSVYGPRQRPDMGLHRLIEAALGRGSFTLYGDGSQVRDMTYVSDVVSATLAAITADLEPSTAVNIAGGSSVSVAELVDLVGTIVGQPVPVATAEAQPGDVDRTGGDTSLAEEQLGWEPKMSLEDGIANQVHWHRTTPVLIG